MSIIKMYTHSLSSKGHKELKRELKERGHNVLSLKKEGSRYRYSPYHFIINWGFQKVWSNGPTPPSSHFLNGDVRGITLASNKKSFFQHVSPHLVPEYATRREDAIHLFDNTDKVYCRTLVSGSEGRGIVIANNPDELPDCSLYTSNVLCQREYRVHVFNSSVIDFAMKKKMGRERREEEGITLNEDIRNHSNGYIFARCDVELPDVVKDVALGVMEEMPLDFGAVDVVHTPYGDAKVLEINTAPGLAGTTVERYTDAVEEWMRR